MLLFDAGLQLVRSQPIEVLGAGRRLPNGKRDDGRDRQHLQGVEKHAAILRFDSQYTFVMPTTSGTSHLEYTRLLLVTALTGLLASGLAGCAPRNAATPPATPAPTAAADERQAILLFRKAVEDYAVLHRRLARSLPRVPADAAAEDVHAQEVAFEKLIAGQRRSSAPGDLFIPQIQPLIRRVASQMLSGPAGAPLLATIKEESAEGRATARVNARYPDSVPLSSVPAQLLSALPTLPDELEYRFVGRDLILLDKKARLVADVMPAVLPR